MIREVELEPRHAGKTAGWRANLCGKVGQRRDVVADDGRGVGELRAGELHAIARIAGETNRHAFEFFDVLFFDVVENRC